MSSNVRLINGDCLEVMRELIDEGVKVNMVLTDLPYGTTQCKWDIIIPFKEMWDCVHRLVYDTSPILFFGNEPFSSMLRLSNLNEYKYDIIWDKVVRTGFLNSKKQPLRQYENILFFYNSQCIYNPIKWIGSEENHPHKTKHKSNNVYGEHHETPTILTREKYPTNIIQFNARKNECNNTKRVHPTQKPVELLEYLIKTYSNPHNTVLDFTMGSGSTGIACQNTNRNFIGIELDKDYYHIAEKRIQENNNQQRLI